MSLFLNKVAGLHPAFFFKKKSPVHVFSCRFLPNTLEQLSCKRVSGQLLPRKIAPPHRIGFGLQLWLVLGMAGNCPRTLAKHMFGWLLILFFTSTWSARCYHWSFFFVFTLTFSEQTLLFFEIPKQLAMTMEI